MQTQTQRRPTVLTMLEAERDTVVARLKAIAAEPSPWYVEGVYVADAADCAVRRGRLIDALMRQHDRLDTAIEEECGVVYGCWTGKACDLPLGTVAAALREVAA